MQLGSSIVAVGVAGAIAGAIALAPRAHGAADAAPAAPVSAAPAPSASPHAPASAPVKPAHVAKRVCTVAAVGDSITDTRSHGGKYLAYLQKHCPQSHFDNYGVGGNMVNQMRRRFARDVLGPSKPHYTHLIVFGGVNDLYSDLTAHRTNERIERDLTKMYKAAHEHGMKVVAITVTPWGGFKRYFNIRRQKHTLELNRWIKAEPDSGNVDFVVDAYPLLSCGDSEKLCPRYAKPFKDGIHFGAAGQKVLGKALYDAVFKSCL